jgi:Ca2+:H+ antiporter
MFEIAMLTMSVLLATIVSQDGKSNWLEGAQLLAVYVMVGLGFFYTGA